MILTLNPEYFKRAENALRAAGIAHPVLVIDKQRLDHNIDCLKQVIDRGFDYRIVAKSLPSVPLLKHIMLKTNTNRLMCFHLPFLEHLVRALPTSDILMGKPMPVEGVRHFYQRLESSTVFNPESQLQWLVDSDARLSEYEKLSRELGITFQINLEVDVGLHRGGYLDLTEFRNSLQRIKSAKFLKLSGLMGYEAHITKIPGLLGGPKKAELLAKQTYQQFVALITEELGELDLCLNMGGSSTYPLYDKGDPCNELATASALVKPSDFDVYTLAEHKVAAFIATPILKTISEPELPMATWLSSFFRLLGLLPREAGFIYGGKWMASPCFPASAKRVDLFGQSSNQEMYSLPANKSFTKDDFMFFWPSQSEAVFLQFGQLVVLEGDKVTDRWPVFSYPDLEA